ncbi:MAG: aspartate aminotransferase family protein [Proteobacteria bacterium]|nr:aspartate aminotransferase family protein [Pseudomonadota bacterium]MDE3208394.1 aspartate aminotransferase family protein [Pseudomonadota bacterium]
MSHLMNTYARLPIAFDHGKGVWLWDKDGNRYLDALSGIAVNGLGHDHPDLTRAISEQAKRLIHTSNLYRVTEQEMLSERLAELSGMQEVFFCNSGAEANEAAIKLARLYGHRKGITSPTIIVTEKSFHGRTIATLSATGNRKVQAGFEPLVAGFIRVPYGNADVIQPTAEHLSSIVGILVEPIQGEGGINVPHPDYLPALRALCDTHGWLLILDEIQSGIARTGNWFAYQHSGVRPDVMTLAKGLGSGVPIGACLASGVAAGVFGPGNHGSTFGGNPLACVAALTTLNVIERDGLITHAKQLGEFLLTALSTQLRDQKGVTTIRGHGLMIGIELDRPCTRLVMDALEQGLLINVTSDNVIRLLPPLVMKHEEAEELIKRLIPLIKRFLAEG